MWLYLIIFVIPFIAYKLGGKENRNKTFLVFYTTFLALFVGLSDMFGGYDRYIYGNVFDSIADGVTHGSDISSIAMLDYFEVGYSALTWLIACVTENRYIYILIITIIIYHNIYKTFERHINNYPLAFIIFLGMVYFFTFTYLRQVVAFSFAWLSIQALIDGKRKKFFLMLVVTALLHKSGIVFAVLLFMPMKKWKPKHVCMILLGCAIIGLSNVTSSFYDSFALSGILTGQSNEYSAGGTARIAYILEVIFFVWIILKNYDHIEENRENVIFLNMAWAFCGFLLMFVRSSDGGRVSWFFTMGIIYIITLIATTNKTKKVIFQQNSVATIMIVVMLFMYVRVYYNWQVYNNLYPYKTFLTDGYRSPDYSHERYEYDFNYDNNKFYRPVFRLFKSTPTECQ